MQPVSAGEAAVKIIKPLDAVWLQVDSAEMPMHVASLMFFSLPPKHDPGLIKDLVTRLKRQRAAGPPWNLRLRPWALRSLLPTWETVEADLDYHVRHYALPQPGGEREMGETLSRVHSRALDPKRPLWECHVIEGLAIPYVAVYTKMHHALVDGIGAMRLMERAFTARPHLKDVIAPWAAGVAVPRGAVARTGGALRTLHRQLRGLPSAARALIETWRGASVAGEPLVAPFSAPQSMLNNRISGQRRFAGAGCELARVQALAKRAGVSVNDVILTMCAGALQRFLSEMDALPGEPLVAGVPVSVRADGDTDVGTAISFILVDLATDLGDPRRRLERIRRCSLAGKAHLRALPKPAMSLYTAALMAPYIVSLLARVAGLSRPMFNLAITNVPGPKPPLYFGNLKLRSIFPISVLTHGQALNITCISYQDSVYFGFTGCRQTMPHMQRLAVYIGDALQELERAYVEPRRQ
jgi:WS/DGAT/MGAT family acyltransferase